MGSGERSAPGFVGDCILKPEGLVIALCDVSSSFNRTSICADAWASTSPDSQNQLFEFNSFLCREMVSERAIAWILVLWGVFRLRVRLHERIDQMPCLESCALLIGNSTEASICLPTGRLGWIDIEIASHSPWREIVAIPPGKYLCRLVGSENPDHWNLFDPTHYPPDDEDWMLHLALLPSLMAK